MQTSNRFTRRHVLKMAGVASAIAMTAGIRGALAQPAKRIEQLDPALDQILAVSQPIQELGSGYGGDQGPAEGPLWWKEGGYLLFSDIHNDRRMKFTPGQGVTLFKQGVNRANGLTRDMQGRLLACEHATRRVTRQEPDGSITVVANSFQGRRLNRPNDVIVKSDGSIYFTDPNHNFVPEQWDLQHPGVYRVTPDLGTLTLVTDSFVGPNGLAFSPDERVLYINDVRHEGGRRGQRLLRRRGRDMDHGPSGQKARPHRARLHRDDQYRVRRRRLENALFHQPKSTRRSQPESCRPVGAGAQEISTASLKR